MTRIPYKIKRHKSAKRLSILIHNDGEVVVTLPSYFAVAIAQKFVAEKRDWIEDRLKYFKKVQKDSPIKCNEETYRKYREDAKRFIESRLEHYNQYYNFRYNRVVIRNQRTCWGSCSPLRNLSFNYKILFLPRSLADYVIVHELCHLGQFNHSRRFWNLVAEQIPSYNKHRRELNNLHWF